MLKMRFYDLQLKLTTHNLQPTTHNPQPTTHNSQLTTYNPQLTTKSQLASHGVIFPINLPTNLAEAYLHHQILRWPDLGEFQ